MNILFSTLYFTYLFIILPFLIRLPDKLPVMKCVFILIHSMASPYVSAQPFYKVTPVLGETIPGRAIQMYEEHPNIWQVDDDYRIWRLSHPQEKTTYTQYYPVLFLFDTAI